MGSIQDKVQQIFNYTKIDPSWSFSDLTRNETTKWTHGYHRYPAKFIPQLVERLFDKYIESKDAHVNDPFYGSGTTIVTAVSRGYIASGTDINGIAHLITQVKSIPIEPSFLKMKIREFLMRITESGEKNIQIGMPENNSERIKYWFPKTNVTKLGRILSEISQEKDKLVRRFLLVSFSHILKSCSIWLQRSTKPTRDPNKIPQNPYTMIERHLNVMMKGNSEFYNQVPERIRPIVENHLKIRVGDARTQCLEDSCTDLIVTSSPYVTSYEYADLHQLSTIWLELADDYKEYRKEFIGTGYRLPTTREPQSEIANQVISNIELEHERTARDVKEFFCDMEEVFLENYRILKSGGHCCYIIGNTKLKGVTIPNAEVFTEGLLHTGFDIDRIMKREIPSKILPQTRDRLTGRFSSAKDATSKAYPTEYIINVVKH